MDIFIIFALIILNGMLSMSELAVVSAKRNRLENSSARGSGGARAALQLADDPSRFLSTVQVGITLIGIFNGAYGEASLVEQLTPRVAAISFLSEYAREISLGIVVVGITFTSIVFGELVPKRIAMQYPEAVATMIAKPMQWLSWAVAPFVKILSFVTETVIRLLGLSKPRENTVTEEDIAGMIEEGAEAGVFEQTEHEIVRRALRLDDQRLGALMTPRMDFEFIDLNDPVAWNLARIADSAYSRFPVCRGERSDVVGIVHAGDLFAQVIRGNSITNIDIERAMRAPLFVPESVSAMDLLETLKQNRAELALVVDEYGEIAGMITLSDMMGALVGDVAILDGDAGQQDAFRRDDGSWLMDAGISLDRFREILGTDIRFPDESAGLYHTLAGFLLTQFGRVPQTSDHIEAEGYRFEVVDMDRQRIDRLLVTPSAPVPVSEPVPSDGGAMQG